MQYLIFIRNGWWIANQVPAAAYRMEGGDCWSQLGSTAYLGRVGEENVNKIKLPDDPEDLTKNINDHELQRCEAAIEKLRSGGRWSDDEHSNYVRDQTLIRAIAALHRY